MRPRNPDFPRSPRFRRLLAIACMLALTVIDGTVCASEDGHHAGYHRNYVAVFGGVTSKDRRKNAATIGIEYERRLSERYGLGFIYEHAYGDLDFNIYAIQFAFHSGPWKWYVAPGIEDAKRHPGNEFLLRVGVEYAFEMGTYELAPQFDVDYVDGDTVLVLGVTVGRGF